MPSATWRGRAGPSSAGSTPRIRSAAGCPRRGRSPACARPAGRARPHRRGPGGVRAHAPAGIGADGPTERGAERLGALAPPRPDLHVKYIATLDGTTHVVEVAGGDGRYRLTIGDDVWDVDARLTAQGIYSLLIGGVSYVADVV